MKIEKITLCLVVIILAGLVYVGFYQPYKQNQKLKKCFDIAVGFEKARHFTDDLTVTNQDVSSFQKNVVACMAD